LRLAGRAVAAIVFSLRRAHTSIYKIKKKQDEKKQDAKKNIKKEK
jgi:hypothetical protein